MRASGTFKVVAFAPASTALNGAVGTGFPAEVAATLEKQYEGDIAGRSATLFAASHDERAEVGACEDVGLGTYTADAYDAGTYVAMETFEGTVGGRDGAFNFAHLPTADATAGADTFIRILPASGTGLLVGIRGTGGMSIDADGTHRIWFDYDLG